MKWFFTRKIRETGALFNGHLIDVRAFYILEFDSVPCISFIGELNVTDAFKYVDEIYRRDIINTYQHCYFNHAEQKSFFNNTVFVLTGNRMIEMGNNYCHVLRGPANYAWADRLIKDLARFYVINEIPAQVQVVGFARQAGMN